MLQFARLWADHPTNNDVQAPCKDRGSPAFENQCAIRLGACLKGSGVKPADLKWPKDRKKPVLCWFHAATALHVIRAEELAVSLRDGRIAGLGRREIVPEPKAFDTALANRTGIVFFKDYWARDGEGPDSASGDHIDLWNGRDTSASDGASEAGRDHYIRGYRKAEQIWFWEVA